METMDIKVLKAFLEICATGNLTQAAQRLYISQPALTRQIQALEDEIGCKLLDRDKRQLTLNDNGRLFELRAREIVRLSEQVKNELSASAAGLRGLIRLGCVESAAMDLLAKVLKDFLHDHPEVQFSLYAADGDDLRRSLDENALDMAMVLEPVEIAKYSRLEVPVRDRFVICMRREDLPEGVRDMSGEAVAALPLVLPRRYLVLDELCEILKVPANRLHVAGYQNLPANALKLVQTGVGALVCVEGAIRDRLPHDLAYVPITPEHEVKHVMIRRRHQPLSKAGEYFWERCLAVMANAAGKVRGN